MPPEQDTTERMQGHWLLAKLGKRVLRPGGIELTKKMLDTLEINNQDNVVEFAPGLGRTATETLKRNPKTYTAVEQSEKAAEQVKRFLNGKNYSCIVGSATSTGLRDACASKVYGEAMLTMQTIERKRTIIREANRILAKNGLYAIHELAITPNNIDTETKKQIITELSKTIKVGAQPLTPKEWADLVEENGFIVVKEETAPMHLLEPTRLIADEGIIGSAKFIFNAIRNGEARKRVIAMRKIFSKHQKNLNAIMLTARKK